MSQLPSNNQPNVDQLIEAILDLKHPLRQAVAGMARYVEPGTKLPVVDEANALQKELQGKPYADLVRLRNALVAERDRRNRQAAADKQAKAKSKAEAAEAKRFYNVSSAMADVGYWARMDFWTAEESLALLLGRDPRVVTTKAVQREIADTKMLLGPPMSKFLEQYEELRALASRAEAMSGQRLRPAAVLAWAQSRTRIQPPPKLVEALAAFSPAPSLEVPAPAAASSPPAQTTATARPLQARATRRDILAPVIEKAQALCSDRFDVAQVWARLQALAKANEPPLFGATEDGIQYHKDGGVAILSREAVAKRVQRARDKS